MIVRVVLTVLYCRILSEAGDISGMTVCFSSAGSPLRTALRTSLIALAIAGATLGAGAAPDEFRPLGAALGGDGDVIALDADRWAFAGVDELTLGFGASAARISGGRYEGLDARTGVRIDGRLVDLVAAIDTGSGDVVLFQGDPAQEKWEEVLQIPQDEALAEALCLFRDPATRNISLFTLDSLGMLEQRYIYDGSNQRLVDLPVRRAVGVLDAQACVVDDDSESLFVADEAFGVRRLSASEETDAVAEPSLMVAPWGKVEGEIEDIAIDRAGALWVLVPEKQQVLRRSRNGALSSLSLPDSLVPAAIAVSHHGDRVVLGVYDEVSGDVWSTTTSSGNGEGQTVPSHGDAKMSSVLPSAETDPVRRYGDAADDPAVVIGEATGDEALILGTDKRSGLAVYGLDGEQRQFLPVGRVNNVDAVTDVMLGGKRRTIAAASNRSHGSVSLFSVENSVVSHLGDHKTSLDDVYGLCMYTSSSGVYVFINDTSGAYEQYRLRWAGDEPSAELVRSFALPSQPEGCAADGATQRIYLGEEAAGVWMAGAEPDGDAPRLVISTGEALVADVEGMDVYDDGDQKLLVVSSQGSDSYAVYDLENDYALVAGFRIRADLARGIDGVSETDGLTVFSEALPGYPRGILVVQDGRNRMPGAPQNFKIVDWRAIQALIDEE